MKKINVTDRATKASFCDLSGLCHVCDLVSLVGFADSHRNPARVALRLSARVGYETSVKEHRDDSPYYICAVRPTHTLFRVVSSCSSTTWPFSVLTLHALHLQCTRKVVHESLLS